MSEVLLYNAKSHFSLQNVAGVIVEGQNLFTEIGLFRKSNGTVVFKVRHKSTGTLQLSNVPTNYIGSYQVTLRTAGGATVTETMYLNNGVTNGNDVFVEFAIGNQYKGAQIIGFKSTGGIYKDMTQLIAATFYNGSANGIFIMDFLTPITIAAHFLNNAPIWNAIPAQTTRKNVAVAVNLPSYVYDLEGDALTYSASSSNTGIATVSISGGVLTITGHSFGTANITVTATDGNLSTSHTFSVAVVNTGPVGTTIPSQITKKDSNITINLANFFSDVDNDALTYTVTSANTNVATVSVSGNTLTVRGVSIGSALITVTASDSKVSASQSFTTTVTNSVPTLAVTAPTSNVTLYENDLLNLAGQAADVDANQSVTIYAQINNEQRIVLAVGLSNAPVTFNKALKFEGGQLFDGEIAITGNLIDGIAHQLKIWAQDGDGAQSNVTERTFYTVPNRPPLITVDTIVPKGIINSDIITISGTAGDPDGNAVIAMYRVNNGNSISLEIKEGMWTFDVTLAQLTVGQNTIVVEVVDTYNSKVSKTIKLNKNEVKTPILHSVARYKIEPPKGSAKGVLLYLQRDEDLTDLTVELSMVIQGEQENYVTLTANNTAPISEGIVEDEFYFEADEAKNHIILKLSTTRPDVSINHKIHLISGVLE